MQLYYIWSKDSEYHGSQCYIQNENGDEVEVYVIRFQKTTKVLKNHLKKIEDFEMKKR